MAGENRKMNLKKQVCNLDNSRAYDGTTTFEQEYSIICYLDNADDTFGIGGNAWIIEEVSDKTVTVEGYDYDDTKKYNIPIGTGVSAVDFPDNNTILIVANKATIIRDYAITLCYEKQTEENGFLGHKAEDGRKYIEVERFIIPLTVKYAM